MKSFAQSIAFLSVSILLALSSPQISNALVSTLENRYSPVFESLEETDAIFVLSTYVEPRNAPPNSAMSATMLSRATEGIRLWHQNSEAQLYLFGRSAAIVLEYAVASGVSRNSIVTLPNVRDTANEVKLISENTKSSHGSIIVSSATHLARTDMLLRCAGVNGYLLAPTDYLAATKTRWFQFSSFFLTKSGRVIHEYLGMLALRIRC